MRFLIPALAVFALTATATAQQFVVVNKTEPGFVVVDKTSPPAKKAGCGCENCTCVGCDCGFVRAEAKSGKAVHVSPDGTVNELHADGVYRAIPGAAKQVSAVASTPAGVGYTTVCGPNGCRLIPTSLPESAPVAASSSTSAGGSCASGNCAGGSCSAPASRGLFGRRR